MNQLSQRQHPPRGAETALKRLTSLARLSTVEQGLVREVAAETDGFAAGAEIYREGEPIRKPRLVLSGWACRQRMLADGRRQIFGFILPGDLIGLELPAGPHPAPQPLAQVTTLALTPVIACDATRLREAALDGRSEHAGLAAAMAAVVRMDQTHLLNHVVRLGRQSAFERAGHLLLELRERLDAAGLVGSREFPLPLTQEVLADALGLSVVHVNRVLQQYRRDGAVVIRSGRASLLKPEELAILTDYRPGGALT